MLRANCPFEELHTQQRVNHKAYLMYLMSQVVIRVT